jgi:hypothetical protein
LLDLQPELLGGRLQAVGLLVDHVAEGLGGFGKLPRSGWRLSSSSISERTSASERCFPGLIPVSLIM